MRVSTLATGLASVLAAVRAMPTSDLAGRNGGPPDLNNAAFQQAVLDAHDQYRYPHCAQHLYWDDGLAQQAQASVNKCTPSLVHDAAGTNLMGGDPAPADYVAQSATIVGQWYSEIKDYNFNAPGFEDATGHFTQVIWRDSSHVGCAWAQCANGVEFASRLYCFYHNVGNIENAGYFPANVWPAICH